MQHISEILINYSSGEIRGEGEAWGRGVVIRKRVKNAIR